MLPKVEKIKKKSDIDSELEQPGLFDKENEKDRLVKKRKVVYIAMALTIGLSLIFLIYRSIRNFNFDFKLPIFNFNTSQITTKSDINLPKDSDSWAIFLKKIDSNSIVYQKNDNLILENQALDSILNKINDSKSITTSSYASSLPEGLKIKELIEEKNNNFSYFSKIITPNQELLLIIKINDSKDLNQAKKSIPGLVDQLYWYSLQK